MSKTRFKISPSTSRIFSYIDRDPEFGHNGQKFSQPRTDQVVRFFCCTMFKKMEAPKDEHSSEPKVRKIDPAEAKRRKDVRNIYMLVGIVCNSQTPNLMNELQSFLQDGGNIGQVYKKDRTLLHRFARMDQSQKHCGNVLETLLLWGADPNVRSEELGTPLHEAVNKGRWDYVKLLINFGGNINAAGPDGNSALAIAISRIGTTTRVEDLRYLLAAGSHLDLEPDTLRKLEYYGRAEYRRVFWLWTEMLAAMGLEISECLTMIPYKPNKTDKQTLLRMKREVWKMKKTGVQGDMSLLDLAKMGPLEAYRAAKNSTVRRFMENEWPLIEGEFEICGDVINRNVEAAMGRISLFESALDAFQQQSNEILIELGLAEMILKKLSPADLRRMVLSTKEIM